MQKIKLVLPKVEELPEGKPSFCPRCGSPRLVHHGTLRRLVSDTTVYDVSVQRYRCSHCRFTFRDYPAGVSRARHSNRLVVLEVLLRSIGLSCTATARVLGKAEVYISQATAWRAGRAAGLREPSEPRRRIRVGVLQQGEEPKDSGEDLLLRFIEDPKSGEKIGVEVWNYGNEPFSSELQEFVRSCGAKLTIDSS